MNLRVRKKRNKSGSVSIVIVDRSNRGYKVVETIGCSKNEDEIEKLYQKALKRINEPKLLVKSQPLFTLV